MSGPEAAWSRRPNVVPQLILVLCVWLTLSCVAMFEFWLWPRTTVGWTLTLGLGPVVYVAGALIVEGAMKLLQRVPWVRRSHDWVERQTSGRKFSWLRVGYALAGCLCFLFVALLLWAYDEARPQHEPGAVEQFIARHFR